MGKYEDLQSERDFRLNGPTFAPGQGTDSYSKEFGVSDSWGTPSGESTDWGSAYGGMGIPSAGQDFGSSGMQEFGASSDPFGMNQFSSAGGGGFGVEAPQQGTTPLSQQEPVDIAIEVAKKTGKATVQGLKAFGDSTKGLTAKFYIRWASMTAITGFIFAAVGLLFFIVGFFTPTRGNLPLYLGGFNFLPLLIGPGLVACAGVMITVMPSLRRAAAGEAPTTFQSEPPSFEQDFVSPAESFLNGDDDEEEEGFSFGDSSEDEEEASIDYSNMFAAASDDEEEEEEEPSVSLDELSPGLYSRTVLMDNLISVLPKIDRDFGKEKVIPEKDREFLDYYENLKSASAAVGLYEEQEPVLLEVIETEFSTTLIVQSNAKVNGAKLAEALQEIFSTNERGRIIRPNLTVKVNRRSDKLYFDVIKGDPLFIGLKDTYTKEVIDQYTDTNNKMPFNLGINEYGEVFVGDLANLESMIIGGEPRSGKSTVLKKILLELSALNSPEDLNFLLGDPKGTGSNFAQMRNLPHIKAMATSPSEVLEMLNWVNDVEAPRRKKMMARKEVFKYQEYNERVQPNEQKIPRTIIVLDEMKAMAESMSSEDLKEYFGLLTSMYTSLPFLGISFIFVPHRIVNSYIPKNIYAIVPSKMAFLASTEEIKGALEYKGTFPYRLTEKGQMAAKIAGVNGGVAMYLYSPVITESEFSDSGVFDQIARMWGKLEPEARGNFGPISELESKKKDVEVFEAAFASEKGEPSSFDEINAGVSTGFVSATGEASFGKSEPNFIGQAAESEEDEVIDLFEEEKEESDGGSSESDTGSPVWGNF